MKVENGKVALLEAPEIKRATIIKQAKEKLRQKALEAKVWQWLLQLDDLTINGNVIWTEERKSTSPSRKRKRK